VVLQKFTDVSEEPKSFFHRMKLKYYVLFYGTLINL
jgi:hypothetical protein